MRLVSIGGLLVAVLFGVVLGAMVFRPPSTRAQNRVRIDHVLTGGSMTTSAAGSQIGGFSCVVVQGGITDCYIASLP